MNPLIMTIKTKADELLREGDQLLIALQTFGWKDELPQRRPAVRESSEDRVMRSLLAMDETPETVRVPAVFTQNYYEWYAGCLALVEKNMPSRTKELNIAQAKMSSFLKRGYITFAGQLEMVAEIRQIRGIVGSIPRYLESSLYDLELGVANAFVGSELTEAETLLKVGHVRAAGAVAGVLLERHMKLLCDRHQPAISYPASAAISKLNDLLKDAGVYDTVQWRKVQWMGDIRNACDHARTAEPNKSDVEELITQVRKFVTLFIP